MYLLIVLCTSCIYYIVPFTITSLVTRCKRTIKNLYKNSGDVGIVQKAQKQERDVT